MSLDVISATNEAHNQRVRSAILSTCTFTKSARAKIIAACNSLLHSLEAKAKQLQAIPNVSGDGPPPAITDETIDTDQRE